MELVATVCHPGESGYETICHASSVWCYYLQCACSNASVQCSRILVTNVGRKHQLALKAGSQKGFSSQLVLRTSSRACSGS